MLFGFFQLRNKPLSIPLILYSCKNLLRFFRLLSIPGIPSCRIVDTELLKIPKALQHPDGGNMAWLLSKLCLKCTSITQPFLISSDPCFYLFSECCFVLLAARLWNTIWIVHSPFRCGISRCDKTAWSLRMSLRWSQDKAILKCVVLSTKT